MNSHNHTASKPRVTDEMIAEYFETSTRVSNESYRNGTIYPADAGCRAGLEAVLKRIPHCPQQVKQPAGGVLPISDTFLCRAWGEADLTAAAIVTGWDSVRAFLVSEWLGEEDAEDYDGANTLDRFKAGFDEHEEDIRGGAFVNEFEIGGISVERVFAAPSPAPVPADPVAAPEGWKLVPIEPTPEMIAAMAVEESTGRSDGKPTIGMAGAEIAYEAMLAAAPLHAEGGK